MELEVVREALKKVFHAKQYSGLVKLDNTCSKNRVIIADQHLSKHSEMTAHRNGR